MYDAVIWVRDEKNKQPVLIRAGPRRVQIANKKGEASESKSVHFLLFSKRHSAKQEQGAAAADSSSRTQQGELRVFRSKRLLMQIAVTPLLQRSASPSSGYEAPRSSLC